MPSRNIIKEYAPDSFYHIYARGLNKQKIFQDAEDYRYFTNLFARYLSKKQAISSDGTPYPHYTNKIKLLSYCLMTNHYHFLVHQTDIDDIPKFMRSINTSYSRYFNLRHKRSGPLFESNYKAVHIDRQSYLEHISRYIHLNPRYWQNYYNSSLKFYRDGKTTEWLNTDLILGMFSSRAEYIKFVADYEEMRDMLAEMKYQLADQ